MSLMAVSRSTSGFNAYLAYRKGFAELLDERRYTVGWLDGQILAGAAQVWASDHACLITEIRTYPTGAKDIHALAAVGDLGEIVGALEPLAADWARKQGCLGAVVESREGWSRALKAYGYRPFQMTVRKEL